MPHFISEKLRFQQSNKHLIVTGKISPFTKNRFKYKISSFMNHSKEDKFKFNNYSKRANSSEPFLKLIYFFIEG